MMRLPRAPKGRAARGVSVILAAALIATLLGQPAQATPVLRFLVDDHGDFLIFGNTAAQDCRAAVPLPTVGTIGACGTNTDDSAPDVLWRSDDATMSAAADTSITNLTNRSSSVLKLPAGAVVLYARLYWAAQVAIGATPSPTVTFERPGVFSKTLTADSTRGTATIDNGLRYYQSNTDVTADIQANGNGVYRVGAIDTLSLVNLNQSVDFVGWSIVVFYRLDTAPTRNLALFDGLDRVAGGAPANVTISGFLVPTAGFDAKLGAITYEGDFDLTGDAMLFNGTALTDALNPADNFFNGTRSYLGTAVSNTGDLPQITGNPGSQSSFDTDVVSVTSLVKAGDTSATIQGTSSGDVYFLGAFITSIATLKPVFSDTNKTFSNLSRVGGKIIPGDIIEYTITTSNTGTDTGINVVLKDTLPSTVTYLPNSLVIASGNNTGAKTDAAGDDQGEYDTGTRTVTVRLGVGANATTGGTIKVADPVTTIKFRVTVNAGVTGTLQNQATVSSQGEKAVMQGVTEVGSWLSGDGSNPTVPTKFSVDLCATSANCPPTAPICDATSTPAKCVCKMNSDCQAGLICDVGASNTCVQCTATNTSNCSATSVGAICLPTNMCGCNTNSDCAGRTCNTTTHQCPPIVSADLAVLVTPPATTVAAGSSAVYTVNLVNNGPGAIVNADLSDVLPAGVTGVTWTCTSMAGATCPAGSGTGSIGTGGAVSLPLNGRLTYVVSIPVPGGAAGGSLDYSATGTLPVGYSDPNPGNNTSTASATVVPSTDLSLAVTSSPQALDGSVTHTLTVTNNGPGQSLAQVVTYQIPAGVQVISVTPGAGWSCLNVSATISCTRPAALAASSSAAPVAIKVLAPIEAETLAVQASTQGMDDQLRPLGDTNPANNSVSTTVPLSGPDLALTVMSGPQAPDGTVTHLLQVTNNGPGTAPGESVSYDIPAGYTIKDLVAGLGWSCLQSVSASNGVHVSCTRNTSLAPTLTAPPIQIIVQPPLGSTTLPIVAVTSGLDGSGQPLTNDPMPTNNSVSSATPVAPGPDLALTITSAPQAMDGSIDYTLQLTNNGPGTAPGAAVHFDVPAGTRLKSITPGAGWTCQDMPATGGGTEISCTRSTAVGLGDAPPIHVVVIPPFGSSTLATQGDASGLDGAGSPLIDPSPANNIVDSSIPVVTGPDLALTTTVQPQGVDGSIPVVLQLTNLGDGAAPGALVSYQIPAGALVKSINPGPGWSCSTSNDMNEASVVTCVRHEEIPIGDAPPITIVLFPPAGATTLPTVAFTQGIDAQGQVLFDPNPSNNAVNQNANVDLFRISGGGCACSLLPGQGSADGQQLGGPLALCVLGLLALALRGRRSPRAAAGGGA